MVIGVVLANLAEPGWGGRTVRAKLVLALLRPSLTVTVLLAVPVRPNAPAIVR